jgi:hypothetical protein
MAIDYESDCITIGSEYLEQEKFVNCLVEIVGRTRDYQEPEEFEIDQQINENCEAAVTAAILAFYEVEEEELDAWVDKHRELAHWVAHVAGHTNPMQFDELEDFINDYED